MTVTVLETRNDLYWIRNASMTAMFVSDDKILAVGDMFDYRAQSGEQTFDLQGKTLIPGFIDVHAHGGYGFDAMDGDADQIDEMATKNDDARRGDDPFATTMTQSTENIDKAMRGVKQAAERNHIIQGVHLEGPFISKVSQGCPTLKNISRILMLI